MGWRDGVSSCPVMSLSRCFLAPHCRSGDGMGGGLVTVRSQGEPRIPTQAAQTRRKGEGEPR